ncbi:MAG: prephenate dehydrogenase [Nitrospinae bacterium CG11_big_fil_rev_8_21_14_0_20_56_8]|nr:MAG: prephenate dehydrogenase [Nitrospinae bacterium CG11_big_fil_rev_8_21_14_0_20_56_8]
MTIVGVGLLGASLARACREKGIVNRVCGFGRTRGTLEEAKRRGIIDAFGDTLSTSVKGSDLVVVCSPVTSIAPLVREMLPTLREGCLLTDVGSVKGPVVREIESFLPDRVRFVGSHPIAGGEKSGLNASTSNLFRRAKCIVTPTAKTDSGALEQTRQLWHGVDMDVIEMDMDEHDLVFGAVSHLPHIVAFALMNTVGSLRTAHYDNVASFSGGGLKDITRIASSDPVMWRDICISNRQAILDMIERFQGDLEQTRQWIERNESLPLEQSFQNANRYRMNLA